MFLKSWPVCGAYPTGSADVWFGGLAVIVKEFMYDRQTDLAIYVYRLRTLPSSRWYITAYKHEYIFVNVTWTLNFT